MFGLAQRGTKTTPVRRPEIQENSPNDAFTEIVFSQDGSLNRYPHSGWARAEEGGSWTCATEADFFVPSIAAPTLAVAVNLECCPFLHDQRQERMVDVLIGGAKAATLRLSRAAVEHHQVTAICGGAEQWLHVRLIPHEPERPIDFRVSPDARQLGIFVTRASVGIKPITNINLNRIHDTDFLSFLQFTKKDPVILDVGANIGQTITTFKELFPNCVVHSYEVNPLLLRTLKRTASAYRGTKVHAFGLSDQNGEVELSIPYLDGVLYDQEASIEPDHFQTDVITTGRFAERGGKLEIKKATAKVCIGDELNLSPDIIKIDVEGSESRVVAGLVKTIERFRPTLVIENGDYWRVAEILEKRLGYEPLQYDLGLGLSPLRHARTNTIYVHPDNPMFSAGAIKSSIRAD